LLVRHLPGLEAFVRLRMGAELRQMLSADDVVQSVCREVLGELSDFEFRGEAPFRHWLFVRAENKLRMQHRFHRAGKRDHRAAVPLPDSVTSLEAYRTLCTPSQLLGQREMIQRVEAAFDLLPSDYREAVTLHKLCGLNYGEIATRMDRSEGAVRNLVYRGISRLALLVEGGDTRT